MGRHNKNRQKDAVYKAVRHVQRETREGRIMDGEKGTAREVIIIKIPEVDYPATVREAQIVNEAEKLARDPNVDESAISGRLGKVFNKTARWVRAILMKRNFRP